MTIKEVVEKWSKESYDKQGYVIGGSDITVLIKSLEAFIKKEYVSNEEHNKIIDKTKELMKASQEKELDELGNKIAYLIEEKYSLSEKIDKAVDELKTENPYPTDIIRESMNSQLFLINFVLSRIEKLGEKS